VHGCLAQLILPSGYTSTVCAGNPALICRYVSKLKRYVELATPLALRVQGDLMSLGRAIEDAPTPPIVPYAPEARRNDPFAGAADIASVQQAVDRAKEQRVPGSTECLDKMLKLRRAYKRTTVLCSDVLCAVCEQAVKDMQASGSIKLPKVSAPSAVL
jgi:hypothetical protein